MDNYIVESTKYTLGVDFNAETGVLKMTGSSYPENAVEFFKPIEDWLKKYIEEVKKPIRFELKIDYLNTSSTKSLLDIFDILEEYSQSGGEVKIIWYYEEDDEDMLETGEELTEDFELDIEFKTL